MFDKHRILKDFGDEVHNRRRAKKMTQRVLAEKVGIGQNAISRIEFGAHEPLFATAIRLAEALDMSIDALMEVKAWEG